MTLYKEVILFANYKSTTILIPALNAKTALTG